MTQQQIKAMPNPQTPNNPVFFDENICDGCNTCVDACQVDVFIPHPQPGKPPIILHPEECWYGGCCAIMCPKPGAISFNWPLQARGYWKNKATGEVHQI